MIIKIIVDPIDPLTILEDQKKINMHLWKVLPHCYTPQGRTKLYFNIYCITLCCTEQKMIKHYHNYRVWTILNIKI